VALSFFLSFFLSSFSSFLIVTSNIELHYFLTTCSARPASVIHYAGQLFSPS